ncbi:MAG: response regulator transcription factor [Nitrospirae bacterium]|nr:response regulator transcription factor [Nitrospirota bacterium]
MTRPADPGARAAKRPIRILLVDDQRLFRQSLRHLLEEDPEIEVVGDAGDGQEAVVLATELTPDIVLLDVELPGLSGPNAARLIHERLPKIKILMLSVHDEDERIRESLSGGAIGYIIKDADHREFLRIIKRTMEEMPITSPFLVTTLPQAAAPLPNLTAREREILAHLSEAMSNKEIAQAMNLSPETVKSHLQRIYTKLGVGSRSEAIRLFFQQSAKRPTA